MRARMAAELRIDAEKIVMNSFSSSSWSQLRNSYIHTKKQKEKHKKN